MGWRSICRLSQLRGDDRSRIEQGGSHDGKSGLVTMPCSGEHPRKGQRRLGFPRHRMPVATVFENLKAGVSIEEVMEEFDVTRGNRSTRCWNLPHVALMPRFQQTRERTWMRIRFDHGTPRSLARSLEGHTVTAARSRGWERLTNGALLGIAEEAGFDLLLTTDKNIRYQQNLAGRKIAIVVLGNPQLPIVRAHIQRIIAAVNAATAGSYCQVEIPVE